MNEYTPLPAGITALETSPETRWVFEHIREGYIQHDTSYRYTYANKQIEVFTGKAVHSLIGRNIWDEFPDAVGSKTYEAITQAMEARIEVHNEDYHASTDFWQENRVYPYRAEWLLLSLMLVCIRKKIANCKKNKRLLVRWRRIFRATWLTGRKAWFANTLIKRKKRPGCAGRAALLATP